jgi:hypothetical protein
MKPRFLLTTMIALGLSVSGGAPATAADILDIQASGAGLGSFDTVLIDNANRTLEFNKRFDKLAPIVLTFTMQGGTGGAPFQFLEDIVNHTGTDWLDFHFNVVEPAPGKGVAFADNSQIGLTDFNLQSQSAHRLDFAGFLAHGATTTARFALSVPDAAATERFTFQLIQAPDIPEAGSWAMIVAGLLGVVRLISRRS